MAVHERDLERKIQDLEARLNKALKAAAPLLDLWEPYSPNAGLSSRLVIDFGSVYLSPVRLPYRMQLSRVSILARSTAEAVIHLALYRVAMARPLGDEALLQREGRPTLELVQNLGSITVASTTTAFQRHSLDLSRSVGLNPEFHYFLAAYTPDGADLFQSQVANAGAGGGYRVTGAQGFSQRIDPSLDVAPFWFQLLSPRGVYVYGLRSGSTTISVPDFGGSSAATLDNAYDGGGAGLGRLITADSGAVEINGSAGVVALRIGPGDAEIVSGALLIGDASLNLRIGDSTTVGAGATRSVALGVSADIAASVARGTAVGYDAQVTASFGSSLGDSAVAGSESVAIGTAAAATNQGVAVGYSANNSATGCTAVGHDAEGNANYAIALGWGARGTVPGALHLGVAGTGAVTQIILGGSDTSGAVAASYGIRTTNASGPNVAGSDLLLTPSRSTGSAEGGSLVAQVSPAGSPGSSLNGTRDVLVIEPSGFSGSRNITNNHSNAAARKTEQTVYVETTDATTTSVFEVDTSTLGNGQGHIDFNIVAAGDDDNGASFKRIYRWSRVGGVLAIAALNEDNTEADAGAAAWTCVADVSTDTLRVRVTGAGGVTVRWAGDVMWRFVARS